ncbi:LacI family transcriptional regulator [Clostridia bacterium]|nr:LacI family transcriptional regulator [Clostridia bacterium]
MKTKKKLTAKHIAKIAGVSPTAVSFALNGKAGISDGTRQHIFDVMRRTNYISSKTQTAGHNPNIAMMFRNDPEPISLFYTELNNRMIAICKDHLCNFFVAMAYRKESSIEFSDFMQPNFIDGVITYGDIENDILKALANSGIPFVSLDSSRRNSGQASIQVDYEEAAFRATSFLIGNGHTDIAYIGNNNARLYAYNLLVFTGFQRATSQNRISLNTNRIQFGANDEQGLRDSIDSLIFAKNRPTALFCINDYYAILAIRYLHTIGLRVPDDISVIGIDDINISRSTIPALTTVKVDCELIARKGFEMIQALIKGEAHKNAVINTFEIVERESVKNISENEAEGGS